LSQDFYFCAVVLHLCDTCIYTSPYFKIYKQKYDSDVISVTFLARERERNEKVKLP